MTTSIRRPHVARGRPSSVASLPLLLLLSAPADAGTIRFADVSRPAGLDFV